MPSLAQLKINDSAELSAEHRQALDNLIEEAALPPIFHTPAEFLLRANSVWLPYHNRDHGLEVPLETVRRIAKRGGSDTEIQTGCLAGLGHDILVEKTLDEFFWTKEARSGFWTRRIIEVLSFPTTQEEKDQVLIVSRLSDKVVVSTEHDIETTPGTVEDDLNKADLLIPSSANTLTFLKKSGQLAVESVMLETGASLKEAQECLLKSPELLESFCQKSGAHLLFLAVTKHVRGIKGNVQSLTTDAVRKAVEQLGCDTA